ncbi:MAG: outer membrane beta-barrel protein [Parabacteroides sp.]|nr:outer membrane beta-barrel protein [Parabacteroides sp.]
MRKFILSLIVAAAAIFTSQAQDGLYLGGSFTLADDNGFSFKLAPEIGYHINDLWAIGGELGYSHRDEFDRFYIAPYARCKLYNIQKLSLFVDGTVGLSTGDDDTGFQIGLIPGALFNVCDNISLVTKIGFLGYRDSYLGSNLKGISLSSENISLGFYVEF